MHDGDLVKSFPACIVVYKTQRPAFVLIGENIQPYTVILKTIFFPRYLTYLYKIVAITIMLMFISTLDSRVLYVLIQTQIKGQCLG